MAATREAAILELRSIEAQEEMLFIKRSFELVDLDASGAELDRLHDRRVEIRRTHDDITLAEVQGERRQRQERRITRRNDR